MRGIGTLPAPAIWLLLGIFCLGGSAIQYGTLTKHYDVDPSVYEAVPYVPANDRSDVRAQIVIRGDQQAKDDLWLSITIPGDTQRLVLSGVTKLHNTILTSELFGLETGSQVNVEPNAASCYTEVDAVISKYALLVPLPAGSVTMRQGISVNQQPTSFYSVNLRNLPLNRFNNRVITCAAESLRRSSFYSYSGIIGEPYLELSASQNALRRIPIVTDFSGLASTSNLQFPFYILSRATDTLHNIIQPNGHIRFSFDDERLSNKKDYLIFVFGVLAAVGGSMLIEVARPLIESLNEKDTKSEDKSNGCEGETAHLSPASSASGSVATSIEPSETKASTVRTEPVTELSALRALVGVLLIFIADVLAQNGTMMLRHAGKRLKS